MKSNSGGIDVETYAMAVAKSKKYTDSQMNTINSDLTEVKENLTKHITLTETEYNNLSDEEKKNGTYYYIVEA